MARVTLLGPQRLRPTVGHALNANGCSGPVATITAGWQDREGEDDELTQNLACECRNLKLFERGELLFRDDPELLALLHHRHDRLAEQREYYRLRLANALEAARALFRKEGSASLLGPEQDAAVDDVRRLDAKQIQRVRELDDEYRNRWKLDERESLLAVRRDVETDLEGCNAVVIAGGHVGVLHTRLWLFGVVPLFGERPILAWSAGAMVVSPRIVLFHDNPPQGAGNAEVYGAGFDLCQGVVPLPHAHRRLRLDDPHRVSLFARRFSPAACIAMNDGSRLDWNGRRWATSDRAYRLTRGGRLVRVRGVSRGG